MGALDCDCIENLMGRFEEERKADRIQSCVDHINTAVDVDPWAKELVAEMGKEILKAQLSKEDTTSDCVSRQAAIDAIGGNEPVGDPSKMDDDDVVKMWERIRIINIINKLPSVQPEIIRCKDCKYFEVDEGINETYCYITDRDTGEDDFCSYAKKRGE